MAGRDTAGDIATLQKRVVRHPRDDAARYALGVAHLSARQYPQALRVFRELLVRFPHEAGVHYEYCGVATWICGDRKRAVAVWLDGLQSHDVLGAMGLASSLRFASVVNERLYRADDAIKLLADSVRRARHWANGALGATCKFLGGQMSQRRYTAAMAETDWEAATGEFYCGVMQLASGDLSGFRARMQHCANGPESFQDLPEFFLARYVHENPRRLPRGARRSSS